ncbi:MAG: FGGY family carbohydrate kinase [Gammaproteobacteria bacterium]|nr:FGGY family carbohydrate kinase [Gammaproteobacteria bacterium]
MAHFLVIDQGTHASRCIIFNAAGQIQAKSEHSLSIYRQDNGFIEQNAEEILHSVQQCLDQLRSDPAFPLITAAALITQRSTIVAYEQRSGAALSAAISWQDTRAAASLQPLHANAAEIKSITGLVISPHYGASKINWLLTHNKQCQQALQAQQLIIAPLASYLLRHLSTASRPLIDHVNASRTQLFDINTLQWSQRMINQFKIDQSCLPDVRPCVDSFGLLKQDNIPINLLNGDQNAALFANAMPSDDAILVNIGTGAFALTLTAKLQQHPKLLCGLALSQAGQARYLLEGTVNGAGAALDALFSETDQTLLFKQLPVWLETITEPAVYINSISGLGSPWWNSHITPHYLQRASDQIDLPERAVSVIESIVFLLQNNIELLCSGDNRQIIISGGLSRLDGLCQKLADLSQLDVRRYDNTEASASGAAWILAQSEDQENTPWQPDLKADCFMPAKQPLLHQRYRLFKQELNRLCQNDHK